MNGFIPWNSQPLSKWSRKYAKGKIIDLNGRSTHYIHLGEGDPVILIHGFNMDTNTWANNIEALAANHSVYAIDLWGFGYSTRDPMLPGYALYTEQLQLFMDDLGIEKATLVGHSMGGGAAISFALKYPERVDKLVLVDSTGIPNPLPLRSKFFTLPGVGEFLLSINNNYFRRKNLKDIWFHETGRLTDEVFANTATKIAVGGFGHGGDYEAFASAVGLSRSQREFMRTITRPGAAVVKDLRHPHPFTVQIDWSSS